GFARTSDTDDLSHSAPRGHMLDGSALLIRQTSGRNRRTPFCRCHLAARNLGRCCVCYTGANFPVLRIEGGRDIARG
ncbi:hypothetical protein, partial [Escherichia coli]|uniref:hypothetical protein n=1 Tax=Escherichia coli TaxID=562 RepID=UPI0019622CD5